MDLKHYIPISIGVFAAVILVAAGLSCAECEQHIAGHSCAN